MTPSSTASNRILVTGATGTIGTALVGALRARGADLTVMSSRPGTAVDGVRTVTGNFADPASLARAFAGIDTLFLLLPLVPGKLQLARHAVQAARDAGVRHIVRSSGAGADPGSPVSIARLQGEIDQMVIDSGIAYTLLRPNSFMQNWVTFNAQAVRAGTHFAPHGSGAASLVDARDIGEAAAAVLADPDAHAGRIYTLTGPRALTDDEQVALIGAAIGRPVTHVDVPDAAAAEAMRAGQVPEVMIDWLMSLNHVVRQGWAAGVTDEVSALTGHAPRRFEDFVHEHRAAWL